VEVPLITIGVDAHKRIHVALAIDEAGREVGTWKGANSVSGWRALEQWGAGVGEERQWGIEGAWNYGRGLAQYLVQRGEQVYDINPRWTAIKRRDARRPGKTDKLDARAVALLVRQEAGSLPRVLVEDQTALLDLLTSERESALTEATRIRNQIHAHLLQLDPEYELRMPALRTKSGLKALLNYAAPSTGVLSEERAALVRKLAERLELTLEQVEELEGRIKKLAQAGFSPLTRLCGVNLLTAGTLAAILGPGNRFKSDAQLAAYAGAAPLEASSANLVRHRLNRGGNRRLNTVLYRIVLTQAHHSAEARRYIERRTTEGKTRREAHRALRRFVIRAIWHLWQECQVTSLSNFVRAA
jgi:transposase